MDKDKKNTELNKTQLIILLFIFLVSFLIRLYHINKPPLDFQPIRQYQVAHIVRGMYYEGLDSIPKWQKEIA
ncbi:MAG: hypothetical protein QXT99_10325, partial [Candidatus Nitrosotenuis sp.]